MIGGALPVASHKVAVMSSFLEVGCGTGFVINGIAQLFPALSLKFQSILKMAWRSPGSVSFLRIPLP